MISEKHYSTNNGEREWQKIMVCYEDITWDERLQPREKMSLITIGEYQQFGADGKRRRKGNTGKNRKSVLTNGTHKSDLLNNKSDLHLTKTPVFDMMSHIDKLLQEAYVEWQKLRKKYSLVDLGEVLYQENKNEEGVNLTKGWNKLFESFE